MARRLFALLRTLIVAPVGSTDCPNAQYHTIQSAVTAASAGAMIKVCAGTYIEQVTIPTGKDGLTLYSVPDLQAVIKAPLVMTGRKAIVEVSGAPEERSRWAAGYRQYFAVDGIGRLS